MSDTNQFEELLTCGVSDVIDRQHLVSRLERGDKLRVKLGIDPTSSDIHLGFAAVLWKLRQFQDLGHQIVLIIGDATAQVGDPAGKNITRPVLTAKQVKAYAETYLEQIGKIIDIDKTEIHWNNQWFKQLDLAGLIKLMSQSTAAQILERDDFAKRLAAGSDIYLHELLYPLMQAYDSVQIMADLELGGSDQRFNILAGRDLQRKMGQPPQDMLLIPLLAGTDGVQKMSKSLGNYIGIAEPAKDMYGKVMSIPDELITIYFQLATQLPIAAVDMIAGELGEGLTNRRDIKMQLAREIVILYHGPKSAAEAEAAFVSQFQKGRLPIDIPSRKMATSYKTAILALADSGLVSSNAEARRLIEQGGVRIGERTISNPLAPVKLKKGLVIQAGKRRFVRVK